MPTPARLLVCAPFLLLLPSCGKEPQLRLEPPVGLELAALVPSPDNPVTLAKAELGMTLFFDPRLSSTGKMSCATCHPPEQAWADGLRFSPKSDGSMNTRNTPSVYNVGYLTKLYWDGRTEPLEVNVRAAWTGQMGADPDAIGRKLTEVAGYRPMFEAAFGGEATGDRIVQALASFLRLLRTGDSPFDRWQAGNQIAVPNEAKEGWEIFRGRGACIQCHVPFLFTDGSFHNTGVGMAAENPDLGRGKFDQTLIGAFKTPSLREVANTAPYFHDGSVATLEEAVRQMSKGGLKNPHIAPELQDRSFSDDDVRKVVAFLRSLSSDKKWTPPRLP
jgi:cytochrome c peroxidase